MGNIRTILVLAAVLSAGPAFADSTAPVAVTQADTLGGLNTAATWTAAGIVVGGAAIIENADSDSEGTSAATGT